MKTIGVPLLSLVLGAVSLVSLTALAVRLLTRSPQAPQGCRDTVLSEHLAGTQTVELQCAPGAHVSWKLEAVGEARWVLVTCECAARLPLPAAHEPPDASAD